MVVYKFAGIGYDNRGLEVVLVLLLRLGELELY